jgi:fatty-acyl-CoA synthase
MSADRTSPASTVHGRELSEAVGSGPLTIPAYLRDVASRYSDREALVCHTAHGVQRWSYATLWGKSVAVASALVAAGVDCDTRVGILMTNRPEFLSALYGVALAGGVAVVFSTFSTAPELEQLLALSDVALLLYEARVLKTDFGHVLATLEPQILTAAPGELQSVRFPYLRRLVHLDPVTIDSESAAPGIACSEHWEDFLARGASVSSARIDARAARRNPGDAGAVFFSSGTTGLPKGILHSQRAFALQWWRYPQLTGIDEAVRCWTANGLFWSGNIAMCVGLAFTNGGTLILQPFFEADATLALIERERISFLHGREHQWARLQESAGWAHADLSSLRYITRGEILWEHPTVATRWRIPMGYGNTETLSICTSNAFNDSATIKENSFGAPLPGNTLKIVDPLTGAVVPRGSSGEICIKGATLMIGYLGRTAEESFDDAGYFRTGDGGHVDEEGCLFWQGRLTEIIKTGGANVSPEEIDQALVLYPGVRRAQTVGLPHTTLGEIVVSCVVPHDGVTLDAASITGFLKARLASYKVPRQILFFGEDELEITGSGKVKVLRLRELVNARL